MTLQFKTLLIVALAAITFSCKKKDNDKIKLQPDELAGAFVDTNYSLKAYSVQLDSTPSSHFQVSRHLVGSYQSDDFGTVNSSFFTQLDLPDDGFDVGDEGVFVSAELWLFKNYFYGGSNGDVNILINQLNSDLIYQEANDDIKKYYIFDNASIGQNLQEITFDSNEDSLVVSLNNSFSGLIWGLKKNGTSNEDFNAKLKGLSFIPSSSNGLIGFAKNDCFIRLKYKEGSEEIITKDFYFNDEVAHFNRITHDRSGTDYSNLKTSKENVRASDLNDKMFVQAGTRTEGVLNFDDLNDKLYNTKQLIYRAEIEIPVQFTSDLVYTSDKYSIGLNIQNTEGLSVGVPTADLSINKFSIDVTQQIQDVIEGQYELGDINVILSQLGHRIDNFWVENPEENIKLKIYFKQD